MCGQREAMSMIIVWPHNFRIQILMVSKHCSQTCDLLGHQLTIKEP